MNLAYEMEYTHPTDEKTSIKMFSHPSGFQEAYKEMYNSSDKTAFIRWLGM